MKSETVKIDNPAVMRISGLADMPHRQPGVPRTRPFGQAADAPDRVPALRFLTPTELLAPPAAGSVTPYVMEKPEPMRGPRITQPRGTSPSVPHSAVNGLLSPPKGLSRRVLVRAFAYMEEHLGENFSLDELAKAVGVSRYHFSRMFRISTGESPMGYCMNLRIARARQLLVRGDHRICDIALGLGFFDQSHFSRVFRRSTGLSPGEYVRMTELAEVAF